MPIKPSGLEEDSASPVIGRVDVLDAKMNLMDIALEEDQEPGKFTNRHNYFRIPLLKNDESK